MRAAHSSPVEDFYDEFLESRMISYRINGNLRLDLARELLLSVVRPSDVVADIGCGIGIIAEAVAKRHSQARVVGVDISQANIRYAAMTVRRRNVEFLRADVTEQVDTLLHRYPTGYDVIALIDVIEHIPERDRTKLLSDLARIAKSTTRLVLTYPSPEYQRHIMATDPSELQLIDNIIEIDVLCREASQSGWTLQLFKKVDVWLHGQYVHCVLGRVPQLGSLEPVERSMFWRLVPKLRGVLLRPYRAWYYKNRLSRAWK